MKQFKLVPPLPLRGKIYGRGNCCEYVRLKYFFRVQSARRLKLTQLCPSASDELVD